MPQLPDPLQTWQVPQEVSATALLKSVQVPAVFVIENNYYSEHTSINYAVGCDDLKARTEAFGFPVFVADGSDRYSAVLRAGTRRFRAILLTSMTTFCGLAPMLLERSAQALEIVPMAISLAFGIVFATVITLLLVPSLYMILDDLDRWLGGRQTAGIQNAAPQGTQRI